MILRKFQISVVAALALAVALPARGDSGFSSFREAYRKKNLPKALGILTYLQTEYPRDPRTESARVLGVVALMRLCQWELADRNLREVAKTEIAKTKSGADDIHFLAELIATRLSAKSTEKDGTTSVSVARRQRWPISAAKLAKLNPRFIQQSFANRCQAPIPDPKLSTTTKEKGSAHDPRVRAAHLLGRASRKEKLTAPELQTLRGLYAAAPDASLKRDLALLLYDAPQETLGVSLQKELLEMLLSAESRATLDPENLAVLLRRRGDQNFDSGQFDAAEKDYVSLEGVAKADRRSYATLKRGWCALNKNQQRRAFQIWNEGLSGASPSLRAAFLTSLGKVAVEINPWNAEEKNAFLALFDSAPDRDDFIDGMGDGFSKSSLTPSKRRKILSDLREDVRRVKLVEEVLRTTTKAEDACNSLEWFSSGLVSLRSLSSTDLLVTSLETCFHWAKPAARVKERKVLATVVAVLPETPRTQPFLVVNAVERGQHADACRIGMRWARGPRQTNLTIPTWLESCAKAFDDPKARSVFVAENVAIFADASTLKALATETTHPLYGLLVRLLKNPSFRNQLMTKLPTGVAPPTVLLVVAENTDFTEASAGAFIQTLLDRNDVAVDTALLQKLFSLAMANAQWTTAEMILRQKFPLQNPDHGVLWAQLISKTTRAETVDKIKAQADETLSPNHLKTEAGTVLAVASHRADLLWKAFPELQIQTWFRGPLRGAAERKLIEFCRSSERECLACQASQCFFRDLAAWIREPKKRALNLQELANRASPFQKDLSKLVQLQMKYRALEKARGFPVEKIGRWLKGVESAKVTISKTIWTSDGAATTALADLERYCAQTAKRVRDEFQNKTPDGLDSAEWGAFTTAALKHFATCSQNQTGRDS